MKRTYINLKRESEEKFREGSDGQVRLEPGPLLNEKGELCQAGYATSLVKKYDRKSVKAGVTRIKEWDLSLIHI